MNRSYYEFPVARLPKLRSLWELFRQISTLLRELLPVHDLREFYGPSMHREWAACHGPPDFQQDSQRERRLARLKPVREKLTQRLPTSHAELGQRCFPPTLNPFKRAFYRGNREVALQCEGVLLCGMNEVPRQLLSNAFSVALTEDYLGLRGLNFYPPYGYRTWHTNLYDPPGWRFYLTDSPSAADSSFRYLDTKRDCIVDSADQPGLIRLFKICDETPYFWHAVRARTWRVSVGALISPQAVKRLTQQAKVISPQS